MIFRFPTILLFAVLLPAFAVGQDEVVVPESQPLPTDLRKLVLIPLPREPNGCEYLNGGLGTTDQDGDGVNNCQDNCVFDRNKNQEDTDNNGVGDACEWRRQKEEWWERIGRRQRQTATEPVDIKRLVNEATNILIVRRSGSSHREDENSLDTHLQVKIIRELKGKARRTPASIYPGIWVFAPDKGPDDWTGELLLFLKNGKLRRWLAPLSWTNTPDGKPYIETHYYGYELADMKYGVLGLSSDRIKQIESIMRHKRQRRQRRP